MNKDEIQHFLFRGYCTYSCGLVMNKDEIQQDGVDMYDSPVVVW